MSLHHVSPGRTHTVVVVCQPHRQLTPRQVFGFVPPPIHNFDYSPDAHASQVYIDCLRIERVVVTRRGVALSVATDLSLDNDDLVNAAVISWSAIN